MPIFNPIQDLDPSGTYTKKMKSNENNSSYCPDTKHSWPSTQVKKRVKNLGKYKYWISAKPGTYTKCPYKVSLNIKFVGSSQEIDLRDAKNTHHRSLCTYVMRYDAYIQSRPRSSPKWYIYHKKWNLVKRIQVIIRTPTVDGRTDGQKDGRTGWIQYTPINFVARGIITMSLSANFDMARTLWYTRAMLTPKYPRLPRSIQRATCWDCGTVGTVKQSSHMSTCRGWRPWNSQAHETV